MTSKKKTRSSLISSVVALLLCFTMLLGTTFAWFTDVVTSTGNTIQSGNLKIDLLHKVNSDWVSLKDNPEHKVFDYDKWEPGYTQLETLNVANLGSLALQYRLSIEVAAGTAVTGKNGENLADVIDVYVTYGESTATSFDDITASNAWVHKGTLSDVMENPASFIGGKLLPTGEVSNTVAVGNQVVSIALHMQESAGNEYQKLSVGDIYVNLIAAQLSYESDSFGPDYDENATFPLTPGKYYTASATVITDANGKVTEEIMVGGANDKANATIPTGVQMKDGVTQATLDIKVVSEYEAVVNAKGGDVIYPLDIHVEGISEDNTVPVQITLNEMFPKHYANYNINLVHVENGVSVEMTPVDTIGELDAHNEFYYDSATGTVIVSMATFSEVTAAVATGNPWDGTSVDTSWYNTTATEFTLADAADLAGFAQIVGGMADGIERDSFAGKTVYLGANMNMGSEDGVIFTPIGYYFTNDYDGNGTPNEDKEDIFSDVYSFEGTFDGQGYTISNIYQNTWEIKGDNNYYDLPNEQYYRDGMGLFGFVYNGTVKNLAMYNFQSDGEFCTTGCVAAYSAGVSTFENIRITNCNPRAYNVPNGGVVGYAYDEEEATENQIIFNNVTVDPTTKITSLWGSWDVGCGGILGRLGDTTKLSMTNCTVGAIMDVYNDVCGNYQYYQFRYCGMLVGTLGSDGDLDDQLANSTFENVSIYYGDWSNNYHYYCELVENSLASYTHDHQFSRLDMIKSLSEIKSGDTWTKTGNFVLVEDGVATCYHIRKDADGNFYQHNHADYNNDGEDDYETVDGSSVLVEDKQVIHIPFNQLFSGYGWGADHGVTVANVTEAKYTVTFMNAAGDVLDVYYVTDNSVALAIEDIDDTARKLLDNSYENDFGGWVTAGSVETPEIDADNTKNFVLYPTHETKYTARWVDEDGNVIYTQTFTNNTTALDEVAGPASSTEVLEFDHWEIRNADGTSTALSDYALSSATGDITLYPYYNVVTGESASLGLTGVDSDGDGVADYYTVEAVDAANIGTDVTIPGSINGVPVKVITDLSSGWASSVENVVIQEGVEEINAQAFGDTSSLKTVELPSTITKIDDSAFAGNLANAGSIVGYKKVLTITYNGTKADWDKVVANSGEWEDGLSEGTTVICTDGTYTLTDKSGNLMNGYNYTWTWTAN